MMLSLTPCGGKQDDGKDEVRSGISAALVLYGVRNLVKDTNLRF